jgi:5-formyltetrahydrofolate cyclo-ligase
MTIHAVATKDALRREALARRGGHDADLRDMFSARLAKEGLAIARRVGAHGVSVFSSIRNEPDTLPLITALADAGFVTALPVTIAGAARLTFRRWRPGEPTRPGQMKIPEPLDSAETIDPDLLFVPLACFDRRGHRIGFGAGHYDRTLAALRAMGRVTAVGVAFASAEADVPDEAHDQRLDFVLTERELIDCGSA